MNTPVPPTVVSENSPLQYYKWGDNCEAWVLVDNEQLSVKKEKMRAGTEELLHYHKKANQFFYILEGRAVFEVDGVVLIVHRGGGLNIEAGKQHRIINKESHDLEFLLISQPSPNNDRFNLV